MKKDYENLTLEIIHISLESGFATSGNLENPNFGDPIPW